MKDKWISVKEERPPYYTNVLVFGGLTGTRRNIAWLASDGDKDIWTRLNSMSTIENVTHWQPLPEPPKSI